MVRKQPMTLDKLSADVNGLTITVDKLAQITAKSFLELNDKIDGVKKELKTDIKDLKNDVNQIDKDIFSFERILMTEVERNDRQDLKINQL